MCLFSNSTNDPCLSQVHFGKQSSLVDIEVAKFGLFAQCLSLFYQQLKANFQTREIRTPQILQSQFFSQLIVYARVIAIHQLSYLENLGFVESFDLLKLHSLTNLQIFVQTHTLDTMPILGWDRVSDMTMVMPISASQLHV